MRNYTSIFVLTALLALSFPIVAWSGPDQPVGKDSPQLVLAAGEMNEQTTGNTEQPEDIKDLSEAERARTIIGELAKNKERETLGYIDDMIVGPDGISYLILSPRGIPEQEGKLIPVPWKLLKGRTHSALIINVSLEQLAKAPGFKADNWPDFSNSQLDNRIRGYYGVK